MNTNVNFAAAMGVVLFLGTCLLMLALALFAAYGLIKRRYKRARVGLAALCGVMLVYLGLIFAFSLGSREKVLARGEEKYFCELDCHLAYSVVDVSQTKTIGNPPNVATAGGMFYIVTIRTRFDENTISPQRGDAPLTPNSRSLAIFDRRGRRYNQSTEGQRALELSGGAGTPITTPLRPGEAYTTALVFDVPTRIKKPTLLINEEMLPTRFIVGHENSFWHGRTKFRLDAEAANSTAAQLSTP